MIELRKYVALIIRTFAIVKGPVALVPNDCTDLLSFPHVTT